VNSNKVRCRGIADDRSEAKEVRDALSLCAPIESRLFTITARRAKLCLKTMRLSAKRDAVGSSSMRAGRQSHNLGRVCEFGIAPV
jgi:hypothetical protein